MQCLIVLMVSRIWIHTLWSSNRRFTRSSHTGSFWLCLWTSCRHRCRPESKFWALIFSELSESTAVLLLSKAKWIGFSTTDGAILFQGFSGVTFEAFFERRTGNEKEPDKLMLKGLGNHVNSVARYQRRVSTGSH